MFAIDGYQELMVLHRALMEAKFSESLNDTAIGGSPILAEISNRVVDALIQESSGTDSTAYSAESWRRWRTAASRVLELEVIRDRIQNTNKWPEWSQDEQRYYLSILLSPFEYDEDFLTSFMESLQC